MKCDEVQTLQDTYLDSELDARTTLEIDQHLATCRGCARLFAEEEKLDARLMAHLSEGPRTAALWKRIESSVLTAASSASSPRPSAQPLGWAALLGVLGAHLRAGWQASRWAWSGLGAAWLVVLSLNLAAREPDAPLVSGQAVPSPSEMRVALEQKHLLMAELALGSESAPANKPKPALPNPRSDRRNETPNA